MNECLILPLLTYIQISFTKQSRCRTAIATATAGVTTARRGRGGEEAGLAYSLYQRIDLDQLTCLNEEAEESGRTVFKPWEARLDREKFVQSDADEELLFNIPFTGGIS